MVGDFLFMLVFLSVYRYLVYCAVFTIAFVVIQMVVGFVLFSVLLFYYACI